MKYEIENAKIKIAIDELGEEYKDMLIEKVLSDNDEYDVNQINLTELLRYDIKSKEMLSTDKRNEKRNRLFTLYSIISMLCILFGLLFLLWEVIRTSHFDITSQLAFAYIFTGLFGFTMAMFMKAFPIKKTKDNSKYYNSEIINQWKIIEARLIQLTPPDIESSLDGMIKHLSEIKLLNEDDVTIIKKLLNLRNQIVHSNTRTRDYTDEEVKCLLRDSSKVTRKLQKFEES